MLERKKVGVALSGGEAKGLAHIGVLRILEENNIPIDFISGTSMGAVVGALYSANPNAKELEKKVKAVKWKKLVDFSFPKCGFIKGDKIEKYLEENLKPCKSFKDLRIPLFVTAVDIENNKEIIFNRGNIVRAVRASISIPEIFVPVVTKKGTLIDGGLLDPLPIQILKESGADIIIAVNVNSIIKVEHKKGKSFIFKNTRKTPNILSTFLKTSSLIVNEMTRNILEKQPGSILITPSMKGIKSSDFSKSSIIIKRGKQATKKFIPEIEKLLK